MLLDVAAVYALFAAAYVPALAYRAQEVVG